MGRRPKQTHLQRRHTDGQQANEKILSISNYQRKALVRMATIDKSTNDKGQKGCGEKGTLLHCCGNVNWYNHYGKLYVGTSGNLIQSYHMIQQFHCWAYTQTKLSLKNIHAPLCSQQYYSQQSRHANNLNVQQQVNRLRRCGTYIQWNISHKKVQNNAICSNMDGSRDSY